MEKIILKIIIGVLKEIITTQGICFPDKIDEDTSIIGKNGILDSLAFVSFVVAVEQKINTEFKTSVSLSDEKAFSQSFSPFRTIGSLNNYITEMLEKIIS